MAPVTVPEVRRRKRAAGEAPLVMVTAYDEPSARLCDAAGVDLLLVGDSVANTVLGYADTLQVTIDDMARHTAAVARARPAALVVGDLPWLSYHTGVRDAVLNAAALVRAGAGCVKLEGGVVRTPVVGGIVDAEIPVMGHLGLTPQSVHAMGGYRVQGRELDDAKRLVEDAHALEDAGCFALVLEGVPDVLAERITATLSIPTIGIGAGPSTDGQVLVFHDLLGLGNRPLAKFVREYASLGREVTDAIGRFADDVRSGAFPGPAETYAASAALREALGE
ncbi:MAG TPA: 3-methyl-2-oxobutanoate hydroxymethyltransferase [Acidimicrobiales bacterium]|nr:3-methyl-2-oxobutanoate hydroxymethyltransferase [Acidimicrobiales bacterium]